MRERAIKQSLYRPVTHNMRKVREDASQPRIERQVRMHEMSDGGSEAWKYHIRKYPYNIMRGWNGRRAAPVSRALTVPLGTSKLSLHEFDKWERTKARRFRSHCHAMWYLIHTAFTCGGRQVRFAATVTYLEVRSITLSTWTHSLTCRPLHMAETGVAWADLDMTKEWW